MDAVDMHNLRWILRDISWQSTNRFNSNNMAV